MKPRIFISSTCYDLKFVREDLADFVKEYDYEPILSENGDIGYTPGQNLDKSCYDAMQTSDMVILIVGSEYGSAASGEVKDGFAEYISITRKEFRTAIDVGIPVFAMIDKKVMTEYGIYETNVEEIEKNNLPIKFKIVKDLNVFRFIKEIKGMITIPIQEFEKSSDIKEFIKKQWSDMFKNYLVSLKEGKEKRKIESSVNEMKTLIQKMDIMLDSVGQNVLSKDDSNKYDEIINEQEILLFCNRLADDFEFCVHTEITSEEERKKIIIVIMNSLKITKNIDDFTSIVWDNLIPYKIHTIKHNTLTNIENGVNILNNKTNFDKIVNIMSKDEFFNRLVVY